MTDLIAEIADLKTQKDATILAHYYQDGEIQELADFTGDSLKLARAATTVQTSTIVFCGVHFMAETAKMLNPDKARAAARPASRLQPGRELSRPTSLARYQEMLRAERPALPNRYLHQQLGRGQGPVGLGRHLRQRRGDHPPRAGRHRKSCLSPIVTWANTWKK